MQYSGFIFVCLFNCQRGYREGIWLRKKQRSHEEVGGLFFHVGASELIDLKLSGHTVPRARLLIGK